MEISVEAARDAGIYDGEEMTCYGCGKVLQAAPEGSENPCHHYGICDECGKKVKKVMIDEFSYQIVMIDRDSFASMRIVSFHTLEEAMVDFEDAKLTAEAEGWAELVLQKVETIHCWKEELRGGGK